jgi:hypothetical protein
MRRAHRGRRAQRAGGGELIDPVGEVLRDVDVARAIGGDAVGDVKLSGATARKPGSAGAGAGLKLVLTVGNAPTIGADERAGSGELIDPVVAVLGDVDVARGIDGDGGGLDERPGADPLDPGLAGGGAGLKLVLTVGNAPAAENSSIRVLLKSAT